MRDKMKPRRYCLAETAKGFRQQRLRGSIETSPIMWSPQGCHLRNMIMQTNVSSKEIQEHILEKGEQSSDRNVDVEPSHLRVEIDAYGIQAMVDDAITWSEEALGAELVEQNVEKCMLENASKPNDERMVSEFHMDGEQEEKVSVNVPIVDTQDDLANAQMVQGSTIKTQDGVVVQRVDDPSHLFRCVKDDNGKKARICLASPACQAHPTYFYRRDGIERHLLSHHGILCFIPGGFLLNDEEDSSTLSAMDETGFHENKKSKYNFYNAEAKYRAARRKFEKCVRQKALQLFNELPCDMRHMKENDFVDSFCRSQMVEYDSKKEERMRKINVRIARGYEASKRDGRVHKKEHSKKHDGNGGKIAHGNATTVNENNKNDINSGTIAQGNEVMTIHSALVDDGGSTSISARLPFLSSRFRNEDENESVGSVEISFGSFCKSLNMTGSQIPKRFQLHCKRLNLAFSCGVGFLTSISTPGVMASTMTLNLLMLWLENTLPPLISTYFWVMDPFWIKMGEEHSMSKMFNFVPSTIRILFLPIVRGEHWSLFIVINFSDNGIQALKCKEGILYMDPLNNSPISSLFDQVKEGVKIVWGSSGRDKLLLRNVPVPIIIPKQPSGIDSGYYVMNSIRSMVEENLQGYHAAQFGTETWFQHDDVRQMRENLARWARKLVGI